MVTLETAKTAEELRREIDELQCQQREVQSSFPLHQTLIHSSRLSRLVETITSRLCVVSLSSQDRYWRDGRRFYFSFNIEFPNAGEACSEACARVFGTRPQATKCETKKSRWILRNWPEPCGRGEKNLHPSLVEYISTLYQVSNQGGYKENKCHVDEVDLLLKIAESLPRVSSRFSSLRLCKT